MISPRSIPLKYTGWKNIPPLLSERIAKAFFYIFTLKRKKRDYFMSGILMMIIAIVVLGGAYLLYGRYQSVIFCGQFNTCLSVSLPAPAFALV